MNLEKKFSNLKVSTKMSLLFTVMLGIVFLFFYYAMPILLNYPPGTINTEFDKSVSITYYAIQCLAVIVILSIIFIIYFKLSLRKLDKWWKNKIFEKDVMLKIRRKCSVFPYETYAIIEIFPVTLATLILMATGSHASILIFKIGTLLFSFQP